MSKNDSKTVCVTGAAGYIGTFVVEALLERGYRVRATARDATDEKKVAHLQELEGDLELFSANLTEPGSFDEAMDGCDLLCHVASVVKLAAKDPLREIVNPAVEGTRNVLTSARRAGTVKRVALTSSIAAILNQSLPRSHVYTEADWNMLAPLSSEPYPLSKARAERAAWDFVGTLPQEERFALCTINPGFVFGPIRTRVHGRSSPTLIRDLLVRTFPACPKLDMPFVDVRDVALAHVRALEREEASGRYILVHETQWMQEIAQRIAPHFPDRRIPTGRLPNVAVYLNALFDKRISLGWAWRNVGRRYLLDNRRAIRELGLEYRPSEETLLDTCHSLIQKGLCGA